ncbi:MAG TPA: rod shape-determining protein [Solirubrobacteraceae bacterium]|jgi:rod shape-determining protein MreB
MLGRFGFGSRDVAIDLGTANTLVYVRGRGIVVSEPSVVAMDTNTGAVHAVGSEAKRMIGRTPANISAIRPLRHGVIADFEVTEEMLRYFMRRVDQPRLSRPRLVMCVPSGVTEVERRAVVDASISAGARQVQLIEEPLAAAIGAGLPIEEPRGHMVVDVGGGTTEVAVISLGGIVVSESVRTGGYELDDAVSAYIRRVYGLAIGQQTAEDIKVELGSAWPLDHEIDIEIRGRHLATGLPRSVRLSSVEVRDALAEPVQTIVDAVKETLERTPPELAADISSEGIVLAGGGVLLQGFAERINEETGMPTRLADSPLTTVAMGSGMALEEFDAMVASDRMARGAGNRRRTAAVG